jgi:hypothetical protein
VDLEAPFESIVQNIAGYHGKVTFTAQISLP